MDFIVGCRFAFLYDFMNTAQKVPNKPFGMIQMTDEAYDLPLKLQVIVQTDYVCYVMYCYVQKEDQCFNSFDCCNLV